MPPLQGKPRRQAPASQAGGFTLIEILLVIALIAILAGIVIFAINPAKQLADGRNAQRRSDVNAILNAVYQYNLDNSSFPAAIAHNEACNGSSGNEICITGAITCTGLSDLAELTNNQKYLVAMPIDPSVAGGQNTGYFISINNNNRVTVCDPSAENGAVISVTR